MAKQELGTVSAHPVKSFFVHMLTRDISLQDAILDLLDNSVDGIQRSASARTLERKKPYEGYSAHLTFTRDSFAIEDNCGGIPWANHQYAFRLGKLKDEIEQGHRTVGTYGIGMKRAIFKIGRSCDVVTHSVDKSYKVTISAKWMADETNWDLPAVAIDRSTKLGTSINIKAINDDIQDTFVSNQFVNSLTEAIATHYAYIIAKGFRIIVNSKEVSPKTIHLLFSNKNTPKDLIRPYIYETTTNDVSVLLAVGFTAAIPSAEEAEAGLENYHERHSSTGAGWTVICNDRTVLYCDKTPLTGWGVSGVPQYHTQFTSIAGVVMFSSDRPAMLPTTTTKRGIDASSTLYLQVKDKMIEGMKIFTQYTYKWKSKELAAQSRERFKAVDKLDMEEIKKEMSKLSLAKTSGALKGRQYKPDLPRPTSVKTTKRISFTKPVSIIRKVSRYLFDTADEDANIVGEKCFDIVQEETS